MGDRGAQRLVKNPLIHLSFLYVGPVASRHLLQSVFFFHADKGIRIIFFLFNWFFHSFCYQIDFLLN